MVLVHIHTAVYRAKIYKLMYIHSHRNIVYIYRLCFAIEQLRLAEQISLVCVHVDVHVQSKQGDTSQTDFNTNDTHSPHRDQHGFTPMHHAAMHGQSSVMDVFINRGARIDIVNMGGDTLLHIAAAYGKYNIVQKVCTLVHACIYTCTYTCIHAYIILYSKFP